MDVLTIETQTAMSRSKAKSFSIWWWCRVRGSMNPRDVVCRGDDRTETWYTRELLYSIKA